MQVLPRIVHGLFYVHILAIYLHAQRLMGDAAGSIPFHLKHHFLQGLLLGEHHVGCLQPHKHVRVFGFDAGFSAIALFVFELLYGTAIYCRTDLVLFTKVRLLLQINSLGVASNSGIHFIL